MFMKKHLSSATTSLKMWYSLPKLLMFFFVFAAFSFPSISSSYPPPSNHFSYPVSSPSPPYDQSSYSDHCDSIVRWSKPRTYVASQILNRHTGYYTGGSGILGQKSSFPPFHEPEDSIQFNFWSVQKTYVPGLFMIEGSLLFPRSSVSYYVENVSKSHRPSSVSFKLSGFWSESSGKICMVGSSSNYLGHGRWLYYPAVLKLYNVMNSTNVTSLISGTLESSMKSKSNPQYFEPVSILIIPRINYEYSLVSNKSDNSCSGGRNIHPSSLPIETVCPVLSGVRRHEFELKYSSHCLSAKNCSPVAASDLPHILSLKAIECSENTKRMRVQVEFGDSSNPWYRRPFYPNTTLVGEASWDAKNNQLCVVACRILNATDSITNSTHVDDCSTRLSLRFPAIWTIGKTSSTVGHIWSNKNATQLGYFESITFESPQNYIGRFLPPGLKYEYTKLDKVTKMCPRKKAAHRKTYKYPKPLSYDMRFGMQVKYKGEVAWGSASPVSIGNRFYYRYGYLNGASRERFVPPVSYSYNDIPVNISYQISINFNQLGNVISKLKRSSNSSEVKIYAEGIYDPTDGCLCMVGCRNLGPDSQQEADDSVDCEILVKFQFPPTNKKNADVIKGSIESTREESDPLHFGSWGLSSDSITVVVAERSIWRMDAEITLVVISTTLACVFVALQLFHVKKHPDVLPSISTFMLLILSLGYMIPLMLNLKAMFTNNNNVQHVLLGGGGWLEANEEIVRVVTMVAFLLQIRLLQLILAERSQNETRKELWLKERKSLFVVLPVYAAGALAAFLFHRQNWTKSHKIGATTSYPDHSILGTALKSYAGLVMDGFLLPQILLNMFCESKEKALSVWFYIGTTFVRGLPHAYDLLRAHNSARRQWNHSHIYASSAVDFYSTAWDVLIPFGGLLFAGIIFLQQKFGGLCVLPPKLRDFVAYEKVPTVAETEG
ncbi:hypothetical protein ACFX11_007682 [Malus domestica]